jgi:NAD(P)-dependent dehydrogenase (short-subunit alcohol dehydrogenase family)
MDQDLHPRTALVTGSTSGIGKATALALALAREGFHVIVRGRDAQRGAATVEEITKAGGHARFVAADLSDAADVERLASEAGEVDVLVNNGGFGSVPPTSSTPLPTTGCSRATSVPPTSWSPRSVRGWRRRVGAASSASTAWPAASVSPTARPRPR